MKMEQLSLPFKNDEIDEWNYLMENSYRIRFSNEQHQFVIDMKRKHGWNFGDKVELNGEITPWGFDEIECDTVELDDWAVRPIEHVQVLGNAVSPPLNESEPCDAEMLEYLAAAGYLLNAADRAFIEAGWENATDEEDE